MSCLAWPRANLDSAREAAGRQPRPRPTRAAGQDVAGLSAGVSVVHRPDRPRRSPGAGVGRQRRAGDDDRPSTRRQVADTESDARGARPRSCRPAGGARSAQRKQRSSADRRAACARGADLERHPAADRRAAAPPGRRGRGGRRSGHRRRSSSAASSSTGGDIPIPPSSTLGGQAVAIAMQYLGTPYVWGGASPGGFDCSGLTMYVYGQLGVGLPHNAAAQYGMGVAVPRSALAARRPGLLRRPRPRRASTSATARSSTRRTPATWCKISSLSGYYSSGVRRRPPRRLDSATRRSAARASGRGSRRCPARAPAAACRARRGPGAFSASVIRSWSSALRGTIPGSSANVCQASVRGTLVGERLHGVAQRRAVGRRQDHVVVQLVRL